MDTSEWMDSLPGTSTNFVNLTTELSVIYDKAFGNPEALFL